MSNSRWVRCKTKEEALRILGMDRPAGEPQEDPKPAESGAPEVLRRPNGVRVVKGGNRV